MCLGHLVPLALFAKVTPSHVEATVFAFVTSIIKGSRAVGGVCFAAFLNNMFIGMTATNQKRIDEAIYMQVFFRLLVFTYIGMVPTLSDIKEVQDRLHAMNEIENGKKDQTGFEQFSDE